MPSDPLTARLRELDASATRGPWSVLFGSNVAATRGGSTNTSVFGAVSTHHPEWHDENAANAALTVAARNALSALAAFVDAADALREAANRPAQTNILSSARLSETTPQLIAARTAFDAARCALALAIGIPEEAK